MQFESLFKPGKMGPLQLKNRIVMSPMFTGLGQPDGSVTEGHINYYSERARGGAGLITTEASYIIARPSRIMLSEDRHIPGLHRLAEAVHQAGSKLCVQIMNGHGIIDPVDPVSPSNIPHRKTGVMPRMLTIQDINEVVRQSADAAVRIKKAGCDAACVHGAHGYLVAQFLSSYTNKRTDSYGGSVENRARFAREIVELVREKTGEDFTIIFRVSASEYIDGGLTLEDTMPICQIMERAGADAIDVTAGSGYLSLAWQRLPMGFPHAPRVPMAEAIKRAVRIPVIVSGGITDPYIAEEIIKQGKADFVSLGRTLIADPEFPKKVYEGSVGDVRPCIHCGFCNDRIDEKKPISCAVNPAASGAKEFAIKPAGKSKKVVVVGGGPAGLQAAVTASQRGHKVTLYEKESRLGGQLVFAVIPPHKAEVGRFTDYLVRQARKNGVQLVQNTEVTAAMVLLQKPDVVIIATGAKPCIPDIPGSRGNNVVTAPEVLSLARQTGPVVVVVGGGMIGGETAEFLAGQGKKVTILEMLDKIGHDLISTRDLFLSRLGEAGVKMETEAKAEAIIGTGVQYTRRGKSEFMPGDTVVLAVGTEPNSKLAAELKGKVTELYQVGDCVQPKRIAFATESALKVALQI